MDKLKEHVLYITKSLVLVAGSVDESGPSKDYSGDATL